MKYNSPELLMVGVAQNLVLGASEQKILFNRNTDDPCNDSYEPLSPLPDDCGW